MIARFKVPINDEQYSINWRQKIIDGNTRDRARNRARIRYHTKIIVLTP